MSGNNDRNNPKNPESELYKKLTKIFSGPIVNQRSQNTRKYRRDKLDKFAKVFKDTQGRKFQRAQNDRIFRDHSAQYLSTFERAQRYADFELMEFDPILASVLDIYADEMTSHNQFQKILHVKSEKNEIRDILSSFFYNVLNVEYNLYSWARQMPVREDSMIPLLSGETITIKELSERCKQGKEEWVYSVQDSSHKIVPGKVVWCDKNYRTNKIVKVWLDDNTFVETAPEHPFVLRDGTQKRADELKSGDSLMPFYTKFSNKKEDSIKDYEKVYNPYTQKYDFTHRIVNKEFPFIIDENVNNRPVIHHIDFDKNNNRPDNLRIMNFYEHFKFHGSHALENVWKLHTPEVTKNRLTALDKFLRSPERANKMSEKMKDVYPEHFQKYNNDIERHSSHNEIRAVAMKKMWQDNKDSLRKQFLLNFDQKCIQIICDIAKKENRYISNKEMCQKLKESSEFVEYYKQINIGKRNKDINKTLTSMGLLALVRKLGYKKYTDVFKENLPELINCDSYRRHAANNGPKNHKVSHIQIIEDECDVYCMTVVGPNGEDDRHNFAICSKTSDGNYSRNGVFVKNCKYGDFYLYLDVDERLGIKRAIVLPPAEVERVEGLDKDNPDYIQYKWSTANVVFENFQVAHFKIDGNDKYAPLGTSVLEPARRIWRQLTLMEDAMMAYRVVRATERKVYYIDIGGIPPEDIEQHMLGIMQSTKKNQIVDPQSGRVDLRYNALSLEDDIYIPVRGTEQGTKIESLPGGDMVGAIDDIKYMKDRLFAAVKIPQSYLIRGEGGEEEKGTLAQKDIRFARTIQRLQRSIVAELDKIAKIHLYTLGYRNADLVSFEILLNNPSKLAEQQELEHWKTKFDVAAGAIETCVSERWIAKNILNLSDEEFLRNRQEILHDVAFSQLKALAEKGGLDGAASTGGGGSSLSDFGPSGDEPEGETPTGADGNEGGGFDLPFSPGDTAAGSIPGEGGEESDSMLLATPGNDSQLKEQGHLTPGSKGHVYHPVKDDQRDDGARTRSFRQAASSRQARMTKGQVNLRLYEILNKAKTKAIYEEDSFVNGLNEETKAILENLKKTGVNKK